MEGLLEFFPLVLYILGAIALVIMIILGIKLMHTIDKANEILDDAYNKTKSLTGLFDMIDTLTDTLSNISDSIVGVVSGVFGRFFGKKKREEDDDE